MLRTAKYPPPAVVVIAGQQAQARPHQRRQRQRGRGRHHEVLTAELAGDDNAGRQAEALVRACYSARGYSTDFLTGEAQPSLIILMRLAGRAVGTFSVRVDAPGPLAADRAFRLELSALRQRFLLVELCRFAIDPSLSRPAASAVLGGMFNALCLVCALWRHQRLGLLFEVNPHHVAFWSSLGWREVAHGWCDRVNARSTLMVNDWQTTWDVVRAAWDGKVRPGQSLAQAWRRQTRYFMDSDDFEGAALRLMAQFAKEAGTVAHPAHAQAPEPAGTVELS